MAVLHPDGTIEGPWGEQTDWSQEDGGQVGYLTRLAAEKGGTVVTRTVTVTRGEWR